MYVVDLILYFPRFRFTHTLYGLVVRLSFFHFPEAAAIASSASPYPKCLGAVSTPQLANFCTLSYTNTFQTTGSVRSLPGALADPCTRALGFSESLPMDPGSRSPQTHPRITRRHLSAIRIFGSFSPEALSILSDHYEGAGDTPFSKS